MDKGAKNENLMTALIALLFLAPALCAEQPVGSEPAPQSWTSTTPSAIEGNVLIDVVKTPW